MRSRWLAILASVIVLVTLAVPVAAQPPSDDATTGAPAAAGQVWFWGYVLDQATREPVQGWVTVKAFDASRGGYYAAAAGPTNASGKYNLGYNGAATKFILVLDVGDEYAPNPSGQKVQIAGPTVVNRDFLVRAANQTLNLSGYVRVKGTNAPVENAAVTVLAWHRTSQGFVIAGSTTTDATGKYSFDYTGMSGRFMVEIRPPAGYVPSLISDQIYMSLGVPGDVLVFYVQPAPISLTFNGKVLIQGTTTGVQSADVTLYQWNDSQNLYEQLSTQATDASGNYSIPYSGSASKFRLVCTAPAGYGPQSQSQDLTVEAGGTPPETTFYLIPNARTLSFTGSVILQGTGTGVPGIWVTLRVFDPAQSAFISAGAQPTDNQGGFNLTYVGTGVHFELICQAEAPWSPASQQVAFSLTPGNYPTSTTFTVSGPIPRLAFNTYLLRQGTNAPVAGGWVTLQAWTGSRYASVAAGPTDSNGKVVLTYTGLATKFVLVGQAPAGYTPAKQYEGLTVPFATRPPNTVFYVTK